MQTRVNIHEAKTHLSRLLAKVSAGEEIIISRAGTPVAKLVPIDAVSPKKRQPGQFKGKMRVSSDFDAPLPDDLLLLFEGAQ